jgi:hypothetical protein
VRHAIRDSTKLTRLLVLVICEPILSLEISSGVLVLSRLRKEKAVYLPG